MFKYKLPDISDNITFYQLLNSLGLAKNKISQLFQMKCCYVNRTLKNQDYILKSNDFIEIDTSIFESMKYKPVDFNLTILYEDDYLIVVDKPSGYIVYDINDEKASVCNFLSFYYLNNKKKTNIFPVQRLDFDTSGCLVFAKDVITASSLSKQFENRVIEKKYIALVQGIVEKEGIIDKKIGSDRHINNKMVISKSGKTAITKYKLLKTNCYTSIIEAIPITGRTHQIRVHFSSTGNPLIGDALYGSKIKNERVLLHCKQIKFSHPFKDKEIIVYSSLPDEFKI